jgi:hypothetical protein
LDEAAMSDEKNGMGGKNNATLGYALTLTDSSGANTTTYVPGQLMTFSLKGSQRNTYKGILLYVSSPDGNTYYGEWESLPTGFRNLNEQCNQFPKNSVLSHSNSERKDVGVELKWKAPATDVGKLKVNAIVVSFNMVNWQILNMELSPGKSDGSKSMQLISFISAHVLL